LDYQDLIKLTNFILLHKSAKNLNASKILFAICLQLPQKKSDLIFLSDRSFPYQFLSNSKNSKCWICIGFIIMLIELYQMIYVIYTIKIH